MEDIYGRKLELGDIVAWGYADRRVEICYISEINSKHRGSLVLTDCKSGCTNNMRQVTTYRALAKLNLLDPEEYFAHDPYLSYKKLINSIEND